MVTILQTFVELVKLMAVVAVAAYLVSRTNWFFDVCRRKINRKSAILMGGIFGAMSVFGNYSNVEIMGAIANVRDLGPMIAGLLGGPLIGFVAGLMGGVYRYFMGGFTAVPCSISTVLSGLLGGLVWLWRRKMISAVWATVFAFSVESLHMLVVLAIAQPFSEALSVVRAVYIPMTLGNSIGIAIFAFIVDNVVKERTMVLEKELLQQELMQKEIRIRELEIGRLEKYSSSLEATMSKLEIVIDEESVRKEAEKVMGTNFFKDLVGQIANVKRLRAAQAATPLAV